MIEIWGKEDCIWCTRAQNLLDEFGIPYTMFKLGQKQRQELYEKITQETGSCTGTMPQIRVNQQWIGGYQQLVVNLDDIISDMQSSDDF